MNLEVQNTAVLKSVQKISTFLYDHDYFYHITNILDLKCYKLSNVIIFQDSQLPRKK